MTLHDSELLHRIPIPEHLKERPSLYYSSSRKWKNFLDSAEVKNKNWMELTEILLRRAETDEIRSGKKWVWIIDMAEQSILYKVFIEHLPRMTQYLMERWENTLIEVYVLRPSTATLGLLKIVETVLPKDRLGNLHKISGGGLEINARLEKLGWSLEERRAVVGLL